MGAGSPRLGRCRQQVSKAEVVSLRESGHPAAQRAVHQSVRLSAEMGHNIHEKCRSLRPGISSSIMGYIALGRKISKGMRFVGSQGTPKPGTGVQQMLRQRSCESCWPFGGTRPTLAHRLVDPIWQGRGCNGSWVLQVYQGLGGACSRCTGQGGAPAGAPGHSAAQAAVHLPHPLLSAHGSFPGTARSELQPPF